MKSIKAKIISLTILLVVVAQAVTGLIIVSKVERAMHHENHERAVDVASDFARVCVTPLISQDLAALQHFVQISMDQKNVTKALVLDHENRVLMHSNLLKVGNVYSLEKGTDIGPGILLKKHYSLEDTEEVDDFYVPVESAGVKLGGVVIGYSHRGIQEAVWSLKKNIALITLASILVTITLAFLLGDHITRPIQHLRKVADLVASGKFNIKKLAETYNDEIGNLAESFYEMAVSLEQKVCHDSLTNLYNRHFFQERLKEECAHSQRRNVPLAVLMIDADHFKNINDTYGHLAGDTVLQGLARILIGKTRGEDCTARYGGEEFVVLLPETAEEGALHLAERIRASVETHLFKVVDNVQIVVTVSVGVVLFPADTTDCKMLLELADQAMYAAKEGGRNRVCLARDCQPQHS